MNIRVSALAATAVPLALLAMGSAWSQVEEPPWQEAPVSAPAWSLKGLVEFTMEGQGSLRFAIDPSTITIGTDGVVRYVFVARSSSGAVNGLYEGIRCQTAEVKQYARWDPDAGRWHAIADARWEPLDLRGPTRRAMKMALSGVCDHKSPTRSGEAMMKALRLGPEPIPR